MSSARRRSVIRPRPVDTARPSGPGAKTSVEADGEDPVATKRKPRTKPEAKERKSRRES